jgi:short-subunit dehydrogenase
MPLNVPIRQWYGLRVWIVGASSGIGAALATELAGRGAQLALSARSRDKLETLAADHVRSVVVPVDVTDNASLARAAGEVQALLGGIDLAIFAAGTYRPVRAWELDAEEIGSTVTTNLTGTMQGVAHVVPQMLERGSGAVAIVASVAGYAGLPKAAIYGPTKAALINFAEVLHIDLSPKGISVFLIDPGFVATPLTAQNDFRMPALIQPDEAARRIVAGFEAGRFEIHFPRRFTCVMKALAWLPRRLYFPLIRRITGL